MSLSARLADATDAVGGLCGDAVVDRADALRGLAHDDVLDLARLAGELSRLVGALGAVVSSELGHRIQTDAVFRRVALGGDQGGRFASELLRDLTRADDDTVRAWEVVGEAIAPRTSLQGEALPCRHEAVAEAVLGASIPVAHAAIVARGISRVAFAAGAEELAAVETTLVDYAGSLTTRQLGKLVRQLPDRNDPDGAAPREEQLRARSSVTIRELPNGLTRLTADLHPEAAGFVRSALDAQTAPRRVAFAAASTETASSDDILADTRPLAQKRVDALTTMARDFLAHDPGRLAGTAVTMLVTVGLDELRTGLGVAHIAGIDEPISATTARRLAADAELVPVVIGGEGEVLDLGRGSRLFTEAQRRAMVVRDGGCIWPGCSAPPAWCEAAHLAPWFPHGRTDLDNGALMCAGHHRRFDHDGWALRRHDGIPYLIPPPWLDPLQAPRRAGRVPALAA
ncbi:DUF222 domain-containing protein [Protaetiibacter sp. SSC-01]|uniref:HNH endonuclease signature motif containing protein n=1 Tax=Protaetiibacter sp. SSC-01 TaxID=2759943 RepID=UPI00165711D1|nr:HNH endonuclease signature motif containing protein [Protaetiibacter sp. SSC-01]QNO37154.1 DUF222 domain-containing protein [Protaetiibacter sp. SSC-01]